MKLAIAHGGALSMTVSNLRNGGDAFLGVTLDHTTAAMLIAATLNSIFITVFNEIYRRVGVMLTDWENHRTESEYENSLILKNAIFQAVNCCMRAAAERDPLSGGDECARSTVRGRCAVTIYLFADISFFYIAFVRPFEVNLFGMTVQGPSGDPLPVRDVCNDGDCMRDLVVQMLVGARMPTPYSAPPWLPSPSDDVHCAPALTLHRQSSSASSLRATSRPPSCPSCAIATDLCARTRRVPLPRALRAVRWSRFARERVSCACIPAVARAAADHMTS
jgi:hypothetical protein